MATFEPSTKRDPTNGKPKWNVGFVSMPRLLLKHQSFADLSGGAAKLLLALLSNYVGNNNGHLVASHSQMKPHGFSSKDSLARAIRELIASGHVIRTREHHLRSPALYAITWLPIDRAPTGRRYDGGITATDEASDSWREVDIQDARCAA